MDGGPGVQTQQQQEVDLTDGLPSERHDYDRVRSWRLVDGSANSLLVFPCHSARLTRALCPPRPQFQSRSSLTTRR